MIAFMGELRGLRSRDAAKRASVIRDFTNVPGSAAGEEQGTFDIVMGLTPMEQPYPNGGAEGGHLVVKAAEIAPANGVKARCKVTVPAYPGYSYEIYADPTMGNLGWAALPFALGATAGQLTISQLVPFARSAGLGATIASYSLVVTSLGNAGGRILSGALSDPLLSSGTTIPESPGAESESSGGAPPTICPTPIISGTPSASRSPALAKVHANPVSVLISAWAQGSSRP